MAMGHRSMSSAEKAMRKDIEGFTANNGLNRIADYVARGRRHKILSELELNEVWIAAFKKMASLPDDSDKRRIVDDLDGEFELRGRIPPYLSVKEDQHRYLKAVREALANMTAEERAAANGNLRRRCLRHQT
jgi:hypothetical protein